MVRGDTFTFIPQTRPLSHWNIDKIEIDIVAVAPSGGDPNIYLSPTIRTIRFNIASGRYTPSEIATLINDECSLIDSEGLVGVPPAGAVDSYPINSSFLTTVLQDQAKLTLENAGTQYLIESKTSGETWDTVMEYDFAGFGGINDRYLGTNQVSLNYDENLKKLNFDILHFPTYVAAAGAVAQPGVSFLNRRVMASYSGVVFSGLRPASFWSEQLGFNRIVQNYSQSTNSFPLGFVGNIAKTFFPFSLVPEFGVTATQAYRGLDLAVEKTNNLFYTVPEYGANAVDTATALTQPIIASREFDSSSNDEGYYLIEIGFSIPQSLIGGSANFNVSNGGANSNKVQSIVGKYFTSGGFISDDGAGSILYQHRGESQLITQLDISIKNPDGTLPTDQELGNLNSIFLELIKDVGLVESK